MHILSGMNWNSEKTHVIIMNMINRIRMDMDFWFLIVRYLIFQINNLFSPIIVLKVKKKKTIIISTVLSLTVGTFRSHFHMI